jgi:hypothetical protein
MDYREESFRRKFNSAAQHLNVCSDQIVSLKFRENVGSYGDYRELVETLRQEAGVHFSEVDGDLQGHGYVLEHDKTKLLLVEHETGLEILYIAGSIASLFGLIPLVLQGWTAIRGLFPRHRTPTDHAVEIRRIDNVGRLREEHLPNLYMPGSPMQIQASVPALLKAASLLEHENKNLVGQVEALTRRIDALEKKASKEKAKNKPKLPKKPRSRANDRKKA